MPFIMLQVERFMFRPGLTDRARYYAVTFLNQLALSHRPQEGGSALAQKLIDIYFSLFKLLLEGKLGNAAVWRKQEHQQQQQQQRRGKGGKGFKKGDHLKNKDEDESDIDDGEFLQQVCLMSNNSNVMTMLLVLYSRCCQRGRAVFLGTPACRQS